MERGSIGACCSSQQRHPPVLAGADVSTRFFSGEGDFCKGFKNGRSISSSHARKQSRRRGALKVEAVSAPKRSATSSVATSNGTAKPGFDMSNMLFTRLGFNPLETPPVAKSMEELELEMGVCIPFRKYTPEGVREKILRGPRDYLEICKRGARILWNVGLYWGALSMDCLLKRGEEMVPLRAEQLRNLLVNLGPSFIKAGQVLANRPDIVREDYMNELCTLQDDVPPFPSEVAFKMIEDEMGCPLEQTFSQISATPVAAASLGQVYRGVLRSTGAEVAVKVQRPGIEPIIYRDLFLFRSLATVFNKYSVQKLGCNGELIVDEFGQKILEELDYVLEARNLQDFYNNFKDDPTVKIPIVYKNLSGKNVLVMEWIDGVRCTDSQAIKDAGIDVESFITVGVSAALRQLLEFGLFHGDPHPGNIFAMRDGRIGYCDFGNVAELSQSNKQVLIDAVVHAVNEDYVEMAGDFTRLGFLAPGTDVSPIVPALEAIWQNSTGKGLADFNFRSVTEKFNKLVYQYPIRIPERFALVIRSLLTQEGICLTLSPGFKFLEVAYPYVAKRLLTDPDPALRERLIQVLFKDGSFQWKRLENLIVLAREQVSMMNKNQPLQASIASKNGSNGRANRQMSGGKLDLTDTISDGARVVVSDGALRQQLLLAFTEGNTLHIKEVLDIYRLVQEEFNPGLVVADLITALPNAARDFMLSWSRKVLTDV